MTIPAAAYVEILNKAKNGTIEGQVKHPASYWISVTKGMRGFFAVMLWDGMGFTEPWDTGIGSYETKEEAFTEAKQWADNEGLEFRA